MRLGTRWPAGSEAPTSLAANVRHALEECERDLGVSSDAEQGQQMFWTLTWLENRPVCTLDSGLVLRTTVSGDVEVIRISDNDDTLDDSDDWLHS